ncbi:MAG: hypothetical protein ACHQ49_11105 [Elusimicrobiota bacterium]
MNRQLLAVLVSAVCMAPSFAAAQSAGADAKAGGEKEWSGVVDNDALRNIVKNSGITTASAQATPAPEAAAAQSGATDACSARPGLAESVTNDMAALENSVAAAPQDSTTGKAVDAGNDLISGYTSSNNGQCVVKTVIGYLQDRGYDMVGDVKVVDRHESVYFVSATSGVLLYGPSQIEDYAKRTFGGYLRSVADARDGGPEKIKRMCAHLAAMPKFPGYSMPDYCAAPQK